MDSIRPIRFLTLCLVAVGGVSSSHGAEAPSVSQALSLKPIQAQVDYTIPKPEEAGQCTIAAEKIGNVTAWVVRNPQREILRRFGDTNNDNVVDQWCYYLDGLEVYRDVDANFNGKADQYRWFHTGGTRTGIDKNEDGRVDAWQNLSPHEIGEQVVFALKLRDPARFQLLLATPEELTEAGFGKARADQIATSIKAAPAAFAKLITDQKTVTAQSRFADFGSARPATIPAGVGDSGKDITVIDNASALVETDGKHEQVYLGTLVSIGGSWKLISAPTIGANNQPQNAFLAQGGGANDAAANAPNEEMQKLLSELERLDAESAKLPDDQQSANIEARAKVLEQLAKVAPADDRDQWTRQLADMLSVAVQSGSYPAGMEKLNQLQTSLAEAGASDDAIAHVVFQQMWADYVTAQRAPNADPAKVQEKWLADLQAFVGKHGKSSDAAEALLQLGMYQEFVGKTEEASKWYQQLVTDFPKAEPTAKARGALARLRSVGKPIKLSGPGIDGGTVDLANYKPKAVLIHYWATWCEPCKEDMVLLKDFYAKKGGRDFDIIGVCLDSSPAAAKQYLAQNRFAWKHIYEPGGLDGRLANEMGVMTPPLMILVDQNGNVVNNNIHVAELETELARVLQPAANTANSPRTTPVPR